MSTLSVTAPVAIPSGWVSLPCCQCQTAILVREDASYTPTCTACRRGEAERDARKLHDEVRDLVKGAGVYNVLSQRDRQEQLNLLGISAVARESVDAAPVYLFPFYDSEGFQPTPAERDEIESRIELPRDDEQEAAERFEPW